VAQRMEALAFALGAGAIEEPIGPALEMAALSAPAIPAQLRKELLMAGGAHRLGVFEQTDTDQLGGSAQCGGSASS
jgi:hypothetical protein